MAIKYKFSDIPNQTIKRKLYEKAVVRWTFKGADDPEFMAKKELNESKAKNNRRWRLLHYIFMKSIDNKRKKLGLEPVYNV